MDQPAPLRRRQGSRGSSPTSRLRADSARADPGLRSPTPEDPPTTPPRNRRDLHRHGRQHRRGLAQDRRQLRRLLEQAARPGARAPAAARRRLRRLRRRSADPFAADRDAAPTAPARTRSTWSARCCTTSATRSAPSTTPTSRRRSASPSSRDENHWMVEKHGIFQGYYFFHHVGMDRDLREQFREHPCFERTARVLRALRQPRVRPGRARPCPSSSSSRWCGACSRRRGARCTRPSPSAREAGCRAGARSSGGEARAVLLASGPAFAS